MLPILLRYGYVAAITVITVIFGTTLTALHYFSTYFLLAEDALINNISAAALSQFDSTARSLGYLPSSIFKPKALPPKTIDEIISREAKKNRVSSALLSGIIYCESGSNFTAKSPVGATGLMQIMPFNSEHCNIPEFKLHDPEANIACGAQIISENLTNRSDNLIAALEEYLGGKKCIGNRCKEGAPYIECVINAMAGRPHRPKKIKS